VCHNGKEKNMTMKRLMLVVAAAVFVVNWQTFVALFSTTKLLGRISEESNHRERQRVVILAGPHKTGTTGVQQCLVDWTINAQLLDQWLWALPPAGEMTELKLQPLGPAKRFAPLLAVLRNEAIFRTGPVQEDSAVALYRDHTTKAWNEERSIVIGAEAMDFIVSDRHDGDHILEGVLSVLPWSQHLPLTYEDVQVVVSYRMPRTSHVTSLWHEHGYLNESLSDFLLRPPESSLLFQSNSLGLALRFLAKGLHTTILDLSGLWSQSIGMCEAIACDVLHVKCTDDHQILSLTNPTPYRKNNKRGKGALDLSVQQFDAIEKIMTLYDCGLRKSIMRLHPQILFQKDLFSSCKGSESSQSFDGMVKSIQSVILQKR
jgi:hypothetical protein